MLIARWRNAWAEERGEVPPIPDGDPGDIHFEDYLAPLASDPHALDELQSTLGAADLPGLIWRAIRWPGR